MKVRLTELAEQDVSDYSGWYDDRQAGLGDRFAAMVLEFTERISVHPRLYERVPRPPKGREVRQGMIPGFPFIAVYEILPTEIVIIDISHAKLRRRPWRGRL
jgi:plasmid stabilization system protein ParE